MLAITGTEVISCLPADLFVSPVMAKDSTYEEMNSGKLRNLRDDEVKRIINSDIVERKFLATADLTRELYDEKASFTDEIDTYSLPKWIAGTQKLFVGEKSRVNLVGEVVVTKERVEFKFDEDLMFRIPLRPVVS